VDDYRWLKRCLKVARSINERVTFARAYRQFRKEGATVVSASTRAVMIANALAQGWTEPR
jgi:hypothetical protein